MYKLEDEAFTIDGAPYHVPCSFFIFDKSDGENLMFDKTLYQTCNDFEWCSKEDADLFIMGAGCKIKTYKEVKPNNRGYYLKAKNISLEELKERLSNTDWKGHSSANGGVSWLTKPEIIKSYIEAQE